MVGVRWLPVFSNLMLRCSRGQLGTMQKDKIGWLIHHPLVRPPSQICKMSCRHIVSMSVGTSDLCMNYLDNYLRFARTTTRRSMPHPTMAIPMTAEGSYPMDEGESLDIRLCLESGVLKTVLFR